MGKCILIVGCEKLQSEYTGYDEFVCVLDDASRISTELAGKNTFLLIVIFWKFSDDVQSVKDIRCITNIPVIVIAEKYSGTEKIALLEAGADEYIQRPETMDEAAASCRALIRRYTAFNQRGNEAVHMAFQGRLVINEDQRRVFVGGKELRLIGQEFDILRILVSSPERVFTYGQLCDMAWKVGHTPTENSIHSCIRRIRRKLEDVPECPCHIENVRGVGYRLRQDIPFI